MGTGEMYCVAVSYDGCTNWVVDHPRAKGTKEQCVEFVAKHLPPRGCDFDLLNLTSGRAVSFVFEPALRRLRLVMQDLRLKG